MPMSPRDLAAAAAKEYSRRLRAFIACRVDNPQDIDDVAQSTIVKVLNIANDTPFINQPLGFLYTTAMRVLAERRIKAAKDRTHIEWSDDVEQLVSIAVVANSGWCQTRNPEDNQHCSGILQRIGTELSQMSPTLSAPLVLIAQGYTYAETAQRLDRTVVAVKKNIQRARAELNKRLSAGQGDDHR